MNAEGTTSERQREPGQRLLTVVCLEAFLFFNSLGSINVALPTIQIQFGSSLAALPVSTALSSPLSGRAADRLEARFVASLGLGFILLGILLYAALSTDSVYLTVIIALTLLGVGIGLFAPANQTEAVSPWIG
jgi:MFS family permease